MKYDNIVRYVVTDPCYILDDDTWGKCCSVLNKYEGEEKDRKFNEAVSNALNEYTGYPSFACDTGYGDWRNKILGLGVIKDDFFADAGMVCVCRLTEKMVEHWEKNDPKTPFLGVAIFEASDDILVQFDTSNKGWTVVNIKDKQTGVEISTLDYDDEYDE